MPERVITKPPSAELKPNQTDQDSLPPYDELDAILSGLIEGEKSVDALWMSAMTVPPCCGSGVCWTGRSTNGVKPRRV
jgi:NH3-dependent NAD+ synthetase